MEKLIIDTMDYLDSKMLDAANFWKGMENTIAMEECGELLQALGKLNRKGLSKKTINSVKGEIRDVFIVLNILMINYNIDKNEIIKMIDEKLSMKKED